MTMLEQLHYNGFTEYPANRGRFFQKAVWSEIAGEGRKYFVSVTMHTLPTATHKNLEIYFFSMQSCLPSGKAVEIQLVQWFNRSPGADVSNEEFQEAMRFLDHTFNTLGFVPYER